MEKLTIWSVYDKFWSYFRAQAHTVQDACRSTQLALHSTLPEAVGLKKETGVSESPVSKWDAWGETWDQLCVHGCTPHMDSVWRVEGKTSLRQPAVTDTAVFILHLMVDVRSGLLTHRLYLFSWRLLLLAANHNRHIDARAGWELWSTHFSFVCFNIVSF